MSLTTTLLPTSTIDAGPGPTGAATVHEALAANNGDGAYVQFGADDSIECGMGDLSAVLGVDGLTLTTSYKYTGPGAWSTQTLRLFVRVGATAYYGATQNASSLTYADLTETWTTNPATGAAWTQAQVNAASAGVEYADSAAESLRVSYLAAPVTYTPKPTSIDVSRHLASVELRLKGQPESFATMEGNLDLMRLSPMLGRVQLHHIAAPHPTENGWAEEVWQQRLLAVHGVSIDPNSYRVKVRMKDQRPILCLVRDLAYSPKASGVLGDGIARFATPGAVFTFERASEHSFTNPVGETEVAPINVPAYGDGGLYMLSASGGRAASRYYVTNNSTARTLNAAQGSFQCEVNLAAVVSGAFNSQTVAYGYHDASNLWRLYYAAAVGAFPLAQDRWAFDIRAGGVTYTAFFNATPSPATWYQIGARWTGANGENDVDPFTLSIFVDRVKGTDAVAGAAMTEAASSNFDFGTTAAAGTDQLNGQIRKILSLQYVMSDTEMQRPI